MLPQPSYGQPLPTDDQPGRDGKGVVEDTRIAGSLT
jgi:hypothetical protein